jgi:hypothetical protein
MEFPSAKDLDIDIDNVEVPPGMSISVFPYTEEYLRDPMWFDALGRDPVDQRKLYKSASSDELKDGIALVLQEWPSFGPAIYEEAAAQGRLDVIRILIELGAESAAQNH